MEYQFNIPGFEGLYTITKSGVITCLPKPKYNNATSKEKVLRVHKDSNGYSIIRLYKNGKGASIRMHRLLALMFIPNPNNYKVINHIDGNKGNYALENLEWVTFSENNKHAFATGLSSNRGEKQSRAILKEKDVLHIRQLYPLFEQLGIAKIYGVSRSVIGSIIRREIWTHI